MIFTANFQIYLQVTFLELYFLDPMVCQLFRISDTLYQIALLKSLPMCIPTSGVCVFFLTLNNQWVFCHICQFSSPKTVSDLKFTFI